MSETVPLLAFVVGSQTYALMITDVVEVAAMVEIVPLPEAAVGLLGVVNRHGEMLPLLDLRVLFNVPSQDVDSNTFFVVAEQQQSRVGLVVDAVDMVQYVSTSAFQAVPDNRFVRAMVQSNGKLLQILDTQPLFARVMLQVER